MTTIITGIYEDYIYAASDSRYEYDSNMHDFEDNGEKFFYAQKTVISVAGFTAPLNILKTMLIDELVVMPQLESGFKELSDRVLHKVLMHYLTENKNSSIIKFIQKDRDITLKFDYIKKVVDVKIGYYDKNAYYSTVFGSGQEYARQAYDGLKIVDESFKDRIEVIKAAIEFASEYDKNTGGKINVMYVKTKEHELGYAAMTASDMINIY